MVNQTITLLSKLKKSVEKMEKEIFDIKEIIQTIERSLTEESKSSEIPITKSRQSKTKKESPVIDLNTIVEKIEIEFKENKFEALNSLVKSKITKDEIINLLQEKGIIIAKNTLKNKIPDEVKRILSNRYSFSKS